jgi:peptidoglycan/xylan/chitin deacetylase (PgdA/CDA1 family)
MKKRARIRRTLANPLAVVAPIVLALLLGWNQYVHNGRDLNVSVQNILPNGSFDDFDQQGRPLDWSINKSGSLDYQVSPQKGFVSGKLLNLDVSKYSSGSLELSSARVDVKPSTTYLYKGYYHASISFDLLVHYYYTNGTDQLKYVRSYPGKNDPWSTVSLGFETGHNIKTVQFVYRAASKGTLQLDNTYLETKTTGVYVPPVLRDTNMLIGNANFNQSIGDMPIGWSTYHAGKNRANFRYVHENDKSYVSATLAKYKSGEAKWQYGPQPVMTGQAFTFGVSYRSTAPAKLVIEYVLQNGKHQFETLATLMPTSDWTRYQTEFEAPTSAKTVFASIVLQANGTLDTDSYALRDSTRPGPHQFEDPLISITFDDGWKSINQNAVPIMDKYGYKGTFYLNPSALDTVNFISADQVSGLRHNGEEIASHGYVHADMTSIDAMQLDEQLSKANNAIHRQFDARKLNFAAPYGKSDAEVQFYARQYYQSLRTTNSGLNTRQDFDPYNLKVLYISGTTTDKEIRDGLADAKAYHGWLILVYHRVQDAAGKVTAAGEDTVVSPEVFNHQMQLVEESKLPVKTVRDALQILQSHK